MLLQPFELVRPQDIEQLVVYTKVFLVSQSYFRAASSTDTHKTNLLLSSYTDLGLAKGHLRVLEGDRYAAIIDLRKPAHRDKVLEMIEEQSNYRLFWAVVETRQAIQIMAEKTLKKKLRLYINAYTNWRPSGDETVDTQLQVIFGELFMILKYNGHKREVKFEDIERL